MSDVILVNEQGVKTGTSDIMEAHTGIGKLHKAFSVYVFRNKRKEILTQRRSRKKMLWPFVWANTCCSHPGDGETLRAAGERRLKEEMGFTCALSEGPSFVYREEDPSGEGVEHEHVTILAGNAEDVVVAPDPDEVAEYKWMNTKKLLHDMEENPDVYAPWLRIGLPKVLAEK
ncbi:isopentenyl-diphosphate delta-isomerase [Candidatus Kaiserbacteria bacterium RIFCSPLOWO2_01_FULL_54_13]|uniref:Isopentenyl-diphosphate delta-isomerase n=1 Tax=Candidatus Kaiserbacteria bacterium RIFCSPLOWO2_01_FULL_54_13 TaxID=1798512 RepID=A0A1F6F3S4_9BACT|nr:MAG: isopentenyl-diphosphate delta-isomerase [Candidatus Kaiserbacteria bacterium RIFCSPLOWO2_01_FULL_54_13]